MVQGYGKPGINKSVDGNPLTIAGKVYSRGIGTHSASKIEFVLNGNAERFIAEVGMDDELIPSGKGLVSFRILLDGVRAFNSGRMKPGDAAKIVDLDISKAQRITLEVNDAGDGIDSDHADWVDARFILKPKASFIPYVNIKIGNRKVPLDYVSPIPAIHGARIVGTTPGNPFIFAVPATGTAPISFSAEKLPKGLSIDKKTGIITGRINTAGEYIVNIKVSNSKGNASRKLKIIAGKNKLALTSPMG
jgi:alpha-galactosidase